MIAMPVSYTHLPKFCCKILPVAGQIGKHGSVPLRAACHLLHQLIYGFLELSLIHISGMAWTLMIASTATALRKSYFISRSFKLIPPFQYQVNIKCSQYCVAQCSISICLLYTSRCV